MKNTPDCRLLHCEDLWWCFPLTSVFDLHVMSLQQCGGFWSGGRGEDDHLACHDALGERV